MSEKNVRVKKVYLNTTVVLITTLLQIFMGFAIRKLFIATLGIAYLGYNSVFNNILSMLNLADLGIGVAITSFLYKPLVENDKDRIKALMYIYKRIYQIIGGFVLVFGLVLSCFLSYLIPDATCSLMYLRILFFINLAGTVSSYFLAYKRTLLIADEKTYETSVVDTAIYFITSVAQILVLFFLRSYVIYLIVMVMKNVVSNIILSLRCDHYYRYLKEGISTDIVNEYKLPIIKYVKDLFVSRLGSYVFYSTDNIIISVFKGSLMAGYLANYTLITTQVQSLITSILSSVQATLGQYINSDASMEMKKRVIDSYLFVDFYIGNFCFLCITFLAGPFVALVFGKQYELTFSTSLWLGINLMLTIMIQLPSQVFIIYKLFHYDRPIIMISATLNIVISAALVQKVGIDGVLIGTFITSLIYLFSRLFIICRKVFNTNVWRDYCKVLSYFLSSIITAFAIKYVLLILPEKSAFISFVIRMIIVGIMALILPAILNIYRKELHFFVEKFGSVLIKRKLN